MRFQLREFGDTGQPANICFWAACRVDDQVVAGLFGFALQHAPTQPGGWMKKQERHNQPL